MTATMDLGQLYRRGRQQVREQGGTTDPVDWRVLEALVDQMEDAGIVAQIVAMYRAELPRRADALRAARGADPEVLRDAAHALAASSLTVGALRLGETCRAVENASSAGDLDLAGALTDQALREIDRVSDAFASAAGRPPFSAG